MGNKLKMLWSNEFIQGGFFLTSSSLLVNLLNYFFHFLAGRTLGPAGYGEIITLFSYLYLTSVPLSVISTVITQKISSRENQYQFVAALEDFFWQKLKKWWFLALPPIIIPFIPRLTNLTLLTSFSLVFLIIISPPGAFYNATLLGLKLFFWLSVIGVAATILKLAGPLLVSFGIDGLATVMTFLLLSGLLPVLANKMFLDRHIKRQQTSQNVLGSKRLLHLIFNKQVIITTISLLAVTALNNLDVIFVKKFLTAEVSGWYGSWSLFARIILFIVSPIIPVSFVFFAGKTGALKQNRVFVLLLAALLFVGGTSYVGYTILAPSLVNILWGDRFNQIIPYLGLAGIFGLLYSIIFFINNYFLAKKSFFALILSFLLPFYVFFLFIIPRNLPSVIRLNIVFSLIVVICYLLTYFISLRFLSFPRKRESIV